MRSRTIPLLIPFALLAVFVPGPGGLWAGPSPVDRAAAITASEFLTGVDHPFFPLVPGTTFYFVERRGKQVSEIETVVTDETRVILGIRCIVVRERVRESGELTQETATWFAQDRPGNVWILGEDAREFLGGGRVDPEGSWEAGVAGAEPGIVMQAAPAPGPPYRHGYARGIAEDRAQVVSVIDSVTVPVGSFAGCVQTKEWSMLESGTDRKWYARGIGLVRAVAATKEVTSLVSVRHP